MEWDNHIESNLKNWLSFSFLQKHHLLVLGGGVML